MAEWETSETAIVEERQELMIDPTSSLANQTPTLRIAHFLKPSVNPTSSLPQFPHIPSSSLSSQLINVVMRPNSSPAKDWELWVRKLQPTHQLSWRKAGISDAIKGSTYAIRFHSELIVKLAERWCPETNTFVFSWGEVTVTLEDVMILGGFSTLGESVLSDFSVRQNVKHLENKLIRCYQTLSKIGRNLNHYRWLKYFMGFGGDIEHAAFLSLWLSRHVFQSKSDSIVLKAIIPLAARLSCGVKIALAPAVLASIYRGLTLLKGEIVRSSGGRCDNDHILRLLVPFQLVQVWAWERFPSLGPVPRVLSYGETRLARWRELWYIGDIYDVEMCLDSARETFRWRPYAMSLVNWSLPRFYVESETWVDVDSDEEFKTFARCLLVSQLVGWKSCIEGYNPHRVTLQFGFDQDIPDAIHRFKSNSRLGRLGYDENTRDLRLYLPSRLQEGDVTYRYSNWWRAGLSGLLGEALIGCKRRKRTLRNAKKLCKVAQSNLSIGDGSSSHNNAFLVTKPLREPVISMLSWKLAEMDQYEAANQDADMVELPNMCLVKKEEDGLVNYFCSPASFNEALGSDYAPKHQFLANEVGQVRVMSPLVTVKRPVGYIGKYQQTSSEQDKKENIVKVVYQTRDEASTEANDASIRVAPAMNKLTLVLAVDEPGKSSDQDADMSHVGDHNPFVAVCAQYETRISRLEREIAAIKAAKFGPPGFAFDI